MPKPSMKSVKMVALCQWFERNAATYMWEPLDDEVVRCPALVGKRKVTVWLPKGAKIQRRHDFANTSPEGGPLVIPPTYKLNHAFGRMHTAPKVKSDLIEFVLVSEDSQSASEEKKT
ncbi:hypothetical protein [Pseudomonas grimontii]|uniref:hypothetical protein n=1 Tax=Pseudomonas grimontii TaxID=129847 RepID=UPI00387B5FF6